MRVGNRASTTIMRARMKRLAKSKTFTMKQKKTGTSNSANKTNQSISELLNSLYKTDKTTTADKMIENRTQTFMYSGMQTAAEHVESHLEKLLETGEDSIFGQADETKAAESAKKEVKAFVNEYNLMVGRLNSSDDSTDKNYAKKLQGFVSANASALKKLGITANTSGTLKLDEKQLAASSLDDLKKTFGEKDGFAAKVLAQTKLIDTHATEQLKELKKSSYAVSSNYNRYGSSTSGTGNWSSYNKKA